MKIKDIKGTTYEIRTESILGFSSYYPERSQSRRKEDMTYEQAYYETTGKPIYEIHIPEFIIKVDKITSESVESAYKLYKKNATPGA